MGKEGAQERALSLFKKGRGGIRDLPQPGDIKQTLRKKPSFAKLSQCSPDVGGRAGSSLHSPALWGRLLAVGCSVTACQSVHEHNPKQRLQYCLFWKPWLIWGKKKKTKNQTQQKATAIAAPTAALPHQQPRLGRNRRRIESLSRHTFSHSLQEISGAHPHEHL